MQYTRAHGACDGGDEYNNPYPPNVTYYNIYRLLNAVIIYVYP